MTAAEPPLLRDVYPRFSVELVRLIEAEGYTDLAICARDLRVFELCGCGDGFCQSFRTAFRPDGGYGPGHWNAPLFPETGWVVLDVVDGRILHVEVLYQAPLS